MPKQAVPAPRSHTGDWARVAELLGRDAAEAIARLADGDPDQDATPAWDALRRLENALADLAANPRAVETLRKSDPSQAGALKILWTLLDGAQGTVGASANAAASTRKTSPRSRSRSSRSKGKMAENAKVVDFVERLSGSRALEEDRDAILSDLRPVDAVTADEMKAIAKGVVGGSYKSKKAALEAIEKWFWHRVRAAEDAKRITRAGAR